MVPIFKDEVQLENTLQKIKVKQNISKKSNVVIQVEGIYVFGGLRANNSITNELKVLMLGEKPLRWTVP